MSNEEAKNPTANKKFQAHSKNNPTAILFGIEPENPTPNLKKIYIILLSVGESLKNIILLSN